MGTQWTRGVKRLVAVRIRRWMVRQKRFVAWPRVGGVVFGSLRRLRPFSRRSGVDRGSSICRYYIEQFLSTYTSDVSGHVLEIEEDTYTRKFGGNRVTKSDVLHYVKGNPSATIVADLTCADQIPSDTFDCIILTQTLQMIYEVRQALGHLHRVLKPGGILLVSANGISKISHQPGVDAWGEYWRFTIQSMKLLLEEVFSPGAVTLRTYGNVLTAAAYLYGLAAEELTHEELDYRDPDYEVLITARAVKDRQQ